MNWIVNMARPALSATRTMDILDLFTAFPTRMFTMSEIMRAVNINVASCHAILSALSVRGYLARRGKSYVLGGGLIAVGQAASLAQPLIARAQAAAYQLNEELGVAVLLSTIAGDEILALTSLPDREGVTTSLHTGQRMPLIPPSGAHFIAWAPAAAVDAWIARAGTDDANEIAEWRRALELIRARGYQVTLRASLTPAFAELMARMAAGSPPLEYRTEAKRLTADHGWTLAQPETIEPDTRYEVVLIAAPIFDDTGNAGLSLGLGGFHETLSGTRINTLAERLMQTCLRVMRETRRD
jgi:DNA-binding IclR family transcriptional regulator